MTTKWQEKGIGVLSKRGTSRTIVKRDERNGRVAGTETEHWDDRRDATVTPATVRYGFGPKED